jgi:hypothetical protein
MRLEVVRKRLFHVEQHPVDPRLLLQQAIEHRRDVFRLLDSAIKIGSQPVDPFLDRDLAYLRQSIVVPRAVITTEFDLEALEAVAANPVAQEDGIAVVRLAAGQLVRFDGILAADQVPCRNGLLNAKADEEVLGKPVRERTGGVRGRLKVMSEVEVHILIGIG